MLAMASKTAAMWLLTWATMGALVACGGAESDPPADARRADDGAILPPIDAAPGAPDAQGGGESCSGNEVCRQPMSLCDQPEVCSNGSCPTDLKQPDGTPCAGGTCFGGVCVPG